MTHDVESAERRERELPDALLPLAPFLHLIWADGLLDDAEIERLRERAGRSGLIDADTRVALQAWLDPTDPPSAADLERLLERIRTHADDLHDNLDLASLGQRLATPAQTRSAAVRRTLAHLQHALDVPADEAARSLVAEAVGDVVEAEIAPADRRADVVEHVPFDTAALHRYLHDGHFDIRQRVFATLTQPAFTYIDDTDTDAYRRTVLRWCRHLADEGFGALALPREFGGEHDVVQSIAAFEAIAHHDLSLLVKYGVQFGLFTGSIFQLGTRLHHERYLRDAASLALPGCFAMTETAHGSNVRDIRTTATYDADTREFVIHTPEPDAQKDYIGNAARDGRAAVVFAQLQSLRTQHGVHAFVVPIRDEHGRPMPGVAIEDCGLKGGLNGVDNGRIRFDHVRVPRAALLDRFGSVSEAGTYSSPIASPTRRFFTMLGTLVAGRIAIACASVSAAKNGLTIAIRYTDRRRQFGPEARPELPLLDYTAMQIQLIPALATGYALNFALHDLVRDYASRAAGDVQPVETLAAALKALASEWTVDTLQLCREACGGQGYLVANRIPRIRADADVFTTFEGANTVLYLLVARGRLSDYREQFGELRLWHLARHIAARAAGRVAALNPIVTRRTDEEHIRSHEFHAAALQYREERLLITLAARLKRRIDQGIDSFHALNDCQDHAILLGRACAERHALDRFHAAVRDCPDAALRIPLGRLASLYGLDRLDTGAGWFLQAGYLEAAKARAIRRSRNELCRELRPAATALATAFGIPDSLLAAPIGRP